MKISAVCATYRRPQLLGQAIRMFELQSYEDRELVILDDANQYPNQKGDRWRLYSVPQKFPSFGAKRNHLNSLATGDVIAIWDDDDVYFPWALDAIAHAMAGQAWVRPSLVWDDGWFDEPAIVETYSRQQGPDVKCYHGAWAYAVDAWKATKYPEDIAGDSDMAFARHMRQIFGSSADSITDRFPEPYYVYRRNAAPARFSAYRVDLNRQPPGCMTQAELSAWGPSERFEKVPVTWPTHYCRYPRKEPLLRPW